MFLPYVVVYGCGASFCPKANHEQSGRDFSTPESQVLLQQNRQTEMREHIAQALMEISQRDKWFGTSVSEQMLARRPWFGTMKEHAC